MVPLLHCSPVMQRPDTRIGVELGGPQQKASRCVLPKQSIPKGAKIPTTKTV